MPASSPWFDLPPAGIYFTTAAETTPLPFSAGTIPILRAWITQTVVRHKGELSELQYIFCDDDYLHALNVEHLDHDTLTDIITFPYGTPPQVWGDLFISTDRVHENAAKRGIDFATELRRVMIHGVLHLLGFGDKSAAEAQAMRGEEDEALARYPG